MTIKENAELGRLGKHNSNSLYADLDYTTPRRVLVSAANGRIVGQIEGNTLRKNARNEIHMLKRPRGCAWDLCVIEKAEASGVRYTEIFDESAGRIYHADLSDFRQYGLEFDRGFGRQIVLPIGRWQVTQPGRPVARQLDLMAVKMG